MQILGPLFYAYDQNQFYLHICLEAARNPFIDFASFRYHEEKSCKPIEVN